YTMFALVGSAPIEKFGTPWPPEWIPMKTPAAPLGHGEMPPAAALLTVPSHVPGRSSCVHDWPWLPERKSAASWLWPGLIAFTTPAYSAVPAVFTASWMFTVCPTTHGVAVVVCALTHVVAVPKFVPQLAVGQLTAHVKP